MAAGLTGTVAAAVYPLFHHRENANATGVQIWDLTQSVNWYIIRDSNDFQSQMEGCFRCLWIGLHFVLIKLVILSGDILIGLSLINYFVELQVIYYILLYHIPYANEGLPFTFTIHSSTWMLVYRYINKGKWLRLGWDKRNKSEKILLHILVIRVSILKDFLQPCAFYLLLLQYLQPCVYLIL